jgi:predicted DNA-binding transcriptional regulator AlpA
MHVLLADSWSPHHRRRSHPTAHRLPRQPPRQSLAVKAEWPGAGTSVRNSAAHAQTRQCLGRQSRWLAALSSGADDVNLSRPSAVFFPFISPCNISVILAGSSSPFTVDAMTLPDPEAFSACDPVAVRKGRPGADRLISIGDIRALFKLGRTAAYELTHRPGFPAPVQVSRRCLRWWASEVEAYADALQREGARRKSRGTTARQAGEPAALPRRITGTVRAARRRRAPA